MATTALLDECDETQLARLDSFIERATKSDNRLIGYSDRTFILRFLIACTWDERKTQDTLRKYLDWKENSYLYHMMENVPLPESILTMPAMSHIGYGKLGHPVIVGPVGMVDIEGLRRTVPYMAVANQRLKATDFFFKLCEETSKKFDKKIDQIYVIIDFKDAKITSFVGDWRAFNQDLGEKLTLYFPEIFCKLFFVNSKGIISKIFNLVSSFITERVRSKIFVLDSHPGETLLQYIDESVLPKCYGGAREDPVGDPMCNNVIDWPTTFPQEKYYRDVFKNHDKSELEEVKIGPGIREELLIGKGKPGDQFKWTIISENGCIGFGILHKREDGTFNEILQPIRINCQYVPEEGSLPIKEAGKYYLVLDNSYSLVNGKKIYISVSLR